MTMKVTAQSITLNQEPERWAEISRAINLLNIILNNSADAHLFIEDLDERADVAQLMQFKNEIDKNLFKLAGF